MEPKEKEFQGVCSQTETDDEKITFDRILRSSYHGSPSLSQIMSRYILALPSASCDSPDSLAQAFDAFVTVNVTQYLKQTKLIIHPYHLNKLKYDKSEQKTN